MLDKNLDKMQKSTQSMVINQERKEEMKSCIRYWASLVAVALFVSGCAFGKSTVKLDFKPQPVGSKADVKTVIAVKKLKEARGIDPYVLAQKGVTVKTSGTYVSEKEVAAVVSEAIKDALAALNYQVSGGEGNLVLDGDLLRFDSNALMGFWSGQVEATIQANMRLTDSHSGSTLWSEVVSGYFKKGHVQIDHEGHRKVVIEGALQDFTSKLANTEGFRKAVREFKPALAQ